MASLFDKVSTLISANLHALVDQALQSNSPAVIDEYIRQAQSNLSDLEDAAAAVGGDVKGIQRKLADQQQEMQQMDKAIDAFLTQGNEASAVALQSRYNSAQQLANSYQEALDRQNAEYKNLLDAKVKLEARLSTMKAEREQLGALLDLAKSKETTVKAMKSLKDLAGSGDADVARIANAINDRLDRASAASEIQSASLDQQMDDVLNRSQLDSQLAERKKKLGLAS